MVADPPETTYAVLGLIDKVPGSSGHDLAMVADRSFAQFWPISRTLLYREVKRVVELGWATADRVEQTRAPGKWVYRSTEEGQRALADWLNRPVSMLSSFRSGVLLRFFFSYRMSLKQAHGLLEEYRTALEVQRSELAALVDTLGTPPRRSGWLNALHGLRTAEARLIWVNEAKAVLDEETGQ